ncbi:MAG: hypothetical protein B5M53_08910 [Candidatus Cloacimonas sp. 4484_209]|nr:MAG: hypothetical protein B5M53_08910 [Candidatus Cloacimonas sp. 4484_209]
MWVSSLMNFKYRKFRAPQIPGYATTKSFLRPVIPIEIINSSKSVTLYALIDSGSDYCIFHGSIGEQIGIDVKSGVPQEIIGIKNQPIKVYFHEVSLIIGGYKSQCNVGFAPEFDQTVPYAILGQLGFFSRYIVTLNYQKERIELKENKHTKKAKITSY